MMLKTSNVSVLSLYDGMACGMMAMRRAGLHVDKYTAFEIDKYAISTAKHNFPEIDERGNVFDGDFTEFEGVDFLIGGSPCFTRGHMVLTRRGYVDISEVVVGDEVLTHRNRWRSVTRLYKRDSKTVNVKITGFPAFETTMSHPFYTIRRSKANASEYKSTHSWRKFSGDPEWIEAGNLDHDSFCGYLMHDATGSNTHNLTEEECYILGRYVSDGHIRNEPRKNRKNSRYYQLVLSIGDVKLQAFKGRVKDNHFSCYPHSKSVHRCVFSSKRLVEIAKEFGCGARSKSIPWFLYDMPLSHRIAFVDGYLDGDGAYTAMRDEFSATTVSMPLALGLQRLISSCFDTNVGVYVSDNNRAHKIDGRIIESDKPIYTLCFKKGLRKQSVARIQNGMVWSAFKSRSAEGDVKTVYNIEVADDNSYTVNNCVVHNCTWWSISQTRNRETTASGLGWELFSQYVRALHEAKPKFFIYENNKSMSDDIRDSIRSAFGFDEVCINSALVAAQTRKRYYWVGKRNVDGTYSRVDVKEPEDRNVLLSSILDCGMSWKDKQQTIDAHYFKGGRPEIRGSQSTRRLAVAEPVRVGCFPNSNGELHDSQGNRVYSPDGKSVTLSANGGGRGAKTGLYAIPVNKPDEKFATPCEWNPDGSVAKATSGADGKAYDVYPVKGSHILIAGNWYGFDMPDGLYIIRKLTVNECKRAQTVDESYEFPVSDTQAYKMLGNGWTVEVISILIRCALDSH